MDSGAVEDQTSDASIPRRHPRSFGGNHADRQPSSRVVHQLLRSAIKSGQLVTGEALREDEYIASLHSTRTAIREALQALADEGLVTRRRQEGTFVAAVSAMELPFEDTAPLRVPPGFSTTVTSTRTFPAHAILRDHLPEAESVVRMLELMISNDEGPIGLLVSFQVDPTREVKMPDVPGGATIADIFSAVYSREFGSMSTRIDAVPADQRTAQLLGVSRGAALLVREQTLSDATGRIHEYSYAHYRADRVSFRSTF